MTDTGPVASQKTAFLTWYKLAKQYGLPSYGVKNSLNYLNSYKSKYDPWFDRRNIVVVVLMGVKDYHLLSSDQSSSHWKDTGPDIPKTGPKGKVLAMFYPVVI